MPGFSDEGFLETLDMIYAAALDPAGWATVLKSLAVTTGCIAGGLTIEDPSTGLGRPLTFFGFDQDHVARNFAHYLPMNPLFSIESRMKPGFVVTNQMVVETSQFRRSEFYDGWAKPQGLCSPISLVLHREGTRYVPLTLVRPDGAGEADEGNIRLLKMLSPHLIRAMAFNLRFVDLECRAAAFKNGFDHLDVGIILLDASDRPVYANRVAEILLRDGTTLEVRKGTLCATDPSADTDLQRLLVGRRSNPTARAGNLALHSKDGARIDIDVNPIGPDADIFGQGFAATLLTIRVTQPISCRGLEGFAKKHRLTARETEMLHALVADGSGLPVAAGRLGIKLSTAKTHLQRIFEKTGSNRQAELVAKVTRCSLDQRADITVLPDR
ncbi:helix-turn-helix transcriptional regulator [Sphingomonas bacterium]|uniref:helix-turn-helix transcriptional regulator n=1 Tax=Sphingomonas bacterium TaxID=1895847 RepID=UPI00157707E0|nr:helix-turn-helix transcriptional regulator [Sphingomonas bacterium]